MRPNLEELDLIKVSGVTFVSIDYIARLSGLSTTLVFLGLKEKDTTMIASENKYYCPLVLVMMAEFLRDTEEDCKTMIEFYLDATNNPDVLEYIGKYGQI